MAEPLTWRSCALQCARAFFWGGGASSLAFVSLGHQERRAGRNYGTRSVTSARFSFTVIALIVGFAVYLLALTTRCYCSSFDCTVFGCPRRLA